MSNAVTGTIAFQCSLVETVTTDLDSVLSPANLSVVKAIVSGTTSDKMDLLWFDVDSLASTTRNLDLRGSLTSAAGTAFSPVEVRLIIIVNSSSTVLLLGGGSNPAFSGLFADASDKISIPPGLFVWYCGTDGVGLQTTVSTADILKLDSGASTVNYTIILGGVSA